MRLILANGRLEFFHALIAIFDFSGHRLQSDVDQFTGLVGFDNSSGRRRLQALDGSSAKMRWLPGNDLIQNRTEKVNVARGSDLFNGTSRHLGCM